MTSKRDVATKQEGGTAISLAIMGEQGAAALKAVEQAMGPGESLTFDLLERAKVPTGGGKAWTMDEGAPTELEGVLVLRQAVRAYWKQSFDETGGGTPPDCSSLDSITGTGDPGGECAKCPFAEYGSAAVGPDGKPRQGQACRQITRVFLLRPDSVLPILINLPPSSFKEAQRYVVTQAARGHSYHSMMTRVGLKPDKSGGGIAYSKAEFSRGRELEPEELTAIENWRQWGLPMLQQISVAATETTE